VPLHLIEHPLAQDALLTLRDVATDITEFRRAAHRITLLVAAEALKGLPTRPAGVQTPIGPATGRAVDASVVVVPILRAGLGMFEAVLQLVPSARVAHIGLRRDEQTAVASRYYSNLPPNLAGCVVLLVDPMLATGGSAVDAVDMLKAAGATSIRMACIVAAPEGVAALEARHPDVAVFTPVVDERLNAQKYIVPGLGDFGDRLYGTL
jgi:uracil phosphoribosyltransferase